MLMVIARVGRKRERNARIFFCCFSWEPCLEAITRLIIYVSVLCMAKVLRFSRERNITQ